MTVSLMGPQTNFDLFRSLARFARTTIDCTNSYSVLLMIADRTIGWNNPDEVITEDHFINGVYGRDGTMYHAGTGISRATLYRCLRKLHDAGVIVVRKIVRKGKTLSVYCLNMEWAVSLMNKGKVAQKAAAAPVKLRDRVSQRHTGISAPVSQRDTKERDPNSFYEKREVKPQPGIEQAVVVFDQKLAVSAEQRIEKNRMKSDPVTLYTAMWVPAVKAAFPDTVIGPLTGKLRGQLKHFATNWKDTVPVADFFMWAATNWRKLYMAKFVYVAEKVKFPHYPSIEFLMGFKAAFLDSWSHRRSIDADAGLTEEDRLRKRLAYQGYTGEGAERELAKIMAQRAERCTLAAERQRLAHEARKLELMERQLNGRASLQPVAFNPSVVPKIKRIVENPTIGALPAWKDEVDDAG